jgi:hypothetical protein
MLRLGWLLPIIVIVVLVIAAITLPAALLVQRVELPVPVTQVQGTIWSGQARVQPPTQSPLQLSWRWHGGARWVWQLTDATTETLSAAGGEAARGAATALSGHWHATARQQVSQVQGTVPLSRVDVLNALVVVRPTGYLEVDLEHVAVLRGQPPRVSGRMVWEQAGLRGVVRESLGRVEMQFSDDEAQRAELRSMDPAAITVEGAIELTASTYGIDLWLSADQHPALRRQLAQWGEPQSDGRVRIALNGALLW